MAFSEYEYLIGMQKCIRDRSGSRISSSSLHDIADIAFSLSSSGPRLCRGRDTHVFFAVIVISMTHVCISCTSLFAVEAHEEGWNRGKVRNPLWF